jgi:selenocysteine lyase/cysteine desulfurase
MDSMSDRDDARRAGPGSHSPSARPSPRPPRRLYFDNAATSFPKPPAVLDAMARYQAELGASPGRGAYRESRASAEILLACRERLATLVNAAGPEHVLFTLNTSDALNIAIKGVLLPAIAREAAKDRRQRRPVHIVATAMDHNSVLRPVNALIRQWGPVVDVEQTIVAADPQTGVVEPSRVAEAIKPHTKLVAAVHASNVTGTLLDVAAIGRACRDAAVPLLVDAAQSVGHLPVDMEAMSIDMLAAPGHKGLLGPLGTGFLALRPGLDNLIDTWREGGTGSVSEEDVMPSRLPDKYEAGSHNTIGIAGLLAGVEYILGRGFDGPEGLRTHERALIEQFINGLHQYTGGPLIEGLRLLGPQGVTGRVGVFSVVAEGLAPGELASRLEDRFGVLTRPGLHCAPHVHSTFGTSPEAIGPDTTDPHTTGRSTADLAGATRFSVGPFLTVQDVKYATDALAEVCEEARAVEA